MFNNRNLLINKTEVRFFVSLGIILSLLVIVSFILSNRIRRGNISSPAKLAEENNPYQDITLTAKAVYVYDVRSGKVLFEKNSNYKLPLASITKIMTALVATENASNEDVILVTNSAIETEGDSGLFVGERWNLKKLLDFSLTSSSNDGVAAVALALGSSGNNISPQTARENFVKLMNSKASELGMNDTRFFNESGLDQSIDESGAYGSAKDITKLLSYILKNHPDILEATKHKRINVTSIDNFTHTAINTDEIVANIPGIKASKTGYTDMAGGNLIVAFDPELGRPIIISVLGSTVSGRFDDVEKLITATLKALSQGQ